MTDHYVSLAYAKDTLGTSIGRICTAMGTLGLKLTNRDTKNRTILSMPARYIPVLEKYFERQAAETMSIAEAARTDGVPRNLYYRAVSMLQLGTKLTVDDRDRVRQALAMHADGSKWYRIIRALGNQARPDTQMDAVFNDVADDLIPQFVMLNQLADTLKVNYATMRTWVAELGIKQAVVSGCRAVSLTDADRIRQRAGKFPFTRRAASLKGIASVTSTMDMDRLRTVYHNLMKEKGITTETLSQRAKVPRKTLTRFLQGGALDPQGIQALQELLQDTAGPS